MPTNTSSAQYTAQADAASNYAAVTLSGTDIGGSVQTALCKCTITTDETAGSTIKLVELPPGSVVLPELCQILVTDDFADAAATIDIGDSGDADRYADGVDCAAVGIKYFLTPAFPAGFATRKGTDAVASATQPGNVILATIATNATPAAGEFYVLIAYKCL
jgi:hypothetical protein